MGNPWRGEPAKGFFFWRKSGLPQNRKSHLFQKRPKKKTEARTAHGFGFFLLTFLKIGGSPVFFSEAPCRRGAPVPSRSSSFFTASSRNDSHPIYIAGACEPTPLHPPAARQAKQWVTAEFACFCCVLRAVSPMLMRGAK